MKEDKYSIPVATILKELGENIETSDWRDEDFHLHLVQQLSNSSAAWVATRKKGVEKPYCIWHLLLSAATPCLLVPQRMDIPLWFVYWIYFLLLVHTIQAQQQAEAQSEVWDVSYLLTMVHNEMVHQELWQGWPPCKLRPFWKASWFLELTSPTSLESNKKEKLSIR